MKRTYRIIFFVLLCVAAILSLVGYMLVLAPVTEEYDGSISLWIPPGSSVYEVADSLHNRGILKRNRGFVSLARLTGWGSQIKAGHYIIESGGSNRDILSKLRRGLQEPVRVEVPAGTRRERVARSIAANMAFTESEMRAAMADETFAMTLQTDTTQLLGYMLPDTYFFYWLTDPYDVIRRIKKATDELVERSRAEGDDNQMTTEEILTMASIVEWETGKISEKARIAGVYMNRLRNGWRLDADPTVQYAVMQLEGNKRRLFFADYRLEHPFNTYRFRGLPPGPVTNPSSSSIEAALHPEENDFFFFVANGDGSHTFSRTLAEHNQRANEYRKLMRERRRKQAATQSSE